MGCPARGRESCQAARCRSDRGDRCPGGIRSRRLSSRRGRARSTRWPSSRCPACRSAWLAAPSSRRGTRILRCPAAPTVSAYSRRSQSVLTQGSSSAGVDMRVSSRGESTPMPRVKAVPPAGLVDMGFVTDFRQLDSRRRLQIIAISCSSGHRTMATTRVMAHMTGIESLRPASPAGGRHRPRRAPTPAGPTPPASPARRNRMASRRARSTDGTITSTGPCPAAAATPATHRRGGNRSTPPPAASNSAAPRWAGSTTSARPAGVRQSRHVGGRAGGHEQRAQAGRRPTGRTPNGRGRSARHRARGS